MSAQGLSGHLRFLATAFARREKRDSAPGTRAAAATRNDSTLISTPPTTFVPTREGYVGFKRGC